MKKIKKRVFIPALAVVGGAAILGCIRGDLLSSNLENLFNISLDKLGWLYQIITAITFVLCIILSFSKKGRIRIGGESAQAHYSFKSWFAMSLTGGIAVGTITYGVSLPMIYFKNIFGELDGFGIAAGSEEAAVFALGRIIHEWSFFPYSIAAVSALCIAYMCYNMKKPLSISSCLIPLLGDKKAGKLATVVDVLAVIALVLGLSGSLGGGIVLIASGLKLIYGIETTQTILIIITMLFAFVFIFSSIRGIKKGVRVFANINTYIFYLLLFILFICGPTLFILNHTTTAFGYWLQNLPLWTFDTGILGGETLVKWWTIMTWNFWIVYAPVTGIFLANISYGRTIREFMIVNFFMPSLFAIIWFGVWGGTAINWQMEGVVDFVPIIQQVGPLSALSAFFNNLPFTKVMIPLMFGLLILSFATSADSNIIAVSSLCIKDEGLENEAPIWVKLTWGLLCSIIACTMILFTKEQEGLLAIKYMGSVGGIIVFGVFILMVISTIKIFFIDKND